MSEEINKITIRFKGKPEVSLPFLGGGYTVQFKMNNEGGEQMKDEYVNAEKKILKENEEDINNRIIEAILPTIKKEIEAAIKKEHIKLLQILEGNFENICDCTCDEDEDEEEQMKVQYPTYVTVDNYKLYFIKEALRLKEVEAAAKDEMLQKAKAGEDLTLKQINDNFIKACEDFANTFFPSPRKWEWDVKRGWTLVKEYDS
jgi:hypothetical protein